MSAAMAVAFALAGCQTGGGNSPTAKAGMSAGGSPAIAFESIDGPPQPVFHKLVANLTTEADQRNLRVVSREGEASYRVRGYLAATTVEGQSMVDYAWDVFDRDKVRVLRVAGTEPVGKAADIWARCDDAMIQRIASQSLDEIVARLDGKPVPSRPAPAAPAASPSEPSDVPVGDGPAVASAPSDIPDDAVLPAGAAPALALAAPSR
ncbi:hypothetical protein [Bosea sp. 117]|uniref:hypothetical protein n=1 Tax=Bosea sp. 117 TaxID=1125973 RepID=UPI000A6BA5B2|nr:hypothetical protein [Bosea sp. 117]